MNVHSKMWVGGVALALLIGLALTTGLIYAQGTGPGSGENAAPDSISATVPGAIGVQGKLTDENGTPLNGDYSVRFALYDVDSGGTALCSQTHAVNVVQGLFNSYLDNCYNELYGQKVWLGITVGSDPEMTPRQVIYPVPYALTLKPGAVISGTNDPILTVRNNGGISDPQDYDAFSAYTTGSGEAVQAYATGGYGVFASSDANSAIQGASYNTGTTAAIVGCVTDSPNVCSAYSTKNAAGVIGGSLRGDGVQAYGSGASARGLYAENTISGTAIVANSSSITSTAHLYPTLYLIQQTAGADFVVGASVLYGTRYWRVDRTGKGFFDGGTQVGGADFAEQIAVADETRTYGPGDVLVISTQADRAVELSDEAYSMAVIGVYSTQPGYLAGAPDKDDPLGGLPVAIVGIVPCKVSAENGAIHRGDLLVTSATPGHAMRAGAHPAQGTVLGKALGELKTGTGVIQILVTLQ